MLITAGAVVAAAITLAIVVLHHLGYIRGVRPMAFGAFLETAGWLILFLAAIVAPGALWDADTVLIEVSVAAVGVLCVFAGRFLQRRKVTHG